MQMHTQELDMGESQVKEEVKFRDFFGVLLSFIRGCRFVPYTVSETSRHRGFLKI